ncbi:Uncharacterised protein [Escherichia coli]|nr:Uncharacterised protein [Escherichia coli]
MRYPTREYQRDSPSDLLLRRPQGIKPKKKIVKIRDSGLTRKVISALSVFCEALRVAIFAGFACNSLIYF